MFAILVVMALFTTFLTTPAVMAIYKPLRRVERALPLPQNSEDELRILACIHGPGNVPSLINLIESIHTAKTSPLKLFVMHLVELTDRPSSILMVQKAQKNGFPFVNHLCRGTKRDQIAAAFEAYGQLGRVTVQSSTAISPLLTMHEDICHVAEDRRVEMIILPFHKQWRGEGEEANENVGHCWREVNQRVLKSAPCSVTVLIDRGFNNPSDQAAEPTTAMPKRVGILSVGGPDDREALKLSRRIAGQQLVHAALVRFLQSDGNRMEKEVDELALAEFKRCNGSVEYKEKAVSNAAEEVLRIGESREYDILVVGMGQLPSSMELTGNNTENEDFGAMGDILSSADLGMLPTTLAIQRRKENHSNEATFSELI